MKKFMIGFIVTIMFLGVVALGCVGTGYIVRTLYGKDLVCAIEEYYGGETVETETVETETILTENILREEVAR